MTGQPLRRAALPWPDDGCQSRLGEPLAPQRAGSGQRLATCLYGESGQPLPAATLAQIAALHCASLPKAFVSSLGTGFVEVMYRAIQRSPGSCVVVATGPAGELAGFVAGTVSRRAMFAWVMPRYGARLALEALRGPCSAAALRRAVETGWYLLRAPRDRGPVGHEVAGAAGRGGAAAVAGAQGRAAAGAIGQDQPAAASIPEGCAAGPADAELLSIAVAPQWRHQGVGQALVAALEGFLAARACTRYRVVTCAVDPGSNRFYQATGFACARTFQHHGRPMHEYLKALGPPPG